MINYTYKNNGSKICLLFVHGWGVDSSSLMTIVESIENEYSYLILDLKGFGKSSLERVYTLDDYCIDIKQIVEKEKIEHLCGIGHSFGGKVLLNYLEKYNMESVLLIAPSCYKPPFSLKRKVKIYLYKLFKICKFKIPKNLQGSRDYLNTSNDLRKTFLNVCSYYFSKKRLHKIKKKIYIVGFNLDQEVNKKSLIKLKKYLPNSELYIYDGHHFSYLERIKEIRVIISYMVEENDICNNY